MRPEALRPGAWDRWVRAAVLVWAAVVAAVCVRAAVQPFKRTLYTTWEQAGADWESGRDLYRTDWRADQDQFRYSPTVAVLLVPFSHLPTRLGGVVWRLVNAGALLGGFAAWLRTAPAPRTARQQGILFLLVVPLSLSSLNNGQPNPLVIGLLLAAVAAAGRERWWEAALLVGLATALKIYPLAVGLLMAAAYPRRFTPRLVLALALAAVLPFACQRWDYVVRQNLLWLARLGADRRWDWPPHMAYRDLWLLVRLCRLPLTPAGYVVVQLTAAAGCAVLCVACRLRGLPRREVLAAVLALGSCWMMLCGPASEAATYVLLAPALAWAVLAAGRDGWPRAARWMAGSAFVLLMLCVLAGLRPQANRLHALGLHPAAALLLTAAYGVTLARALASRPAPPEPARAAADTGNGEAKWPRLIAS